MLLFLDTCPPELEAGAPWDALAGCSVDGKSLYAVVALKEIGGGPLLECKFQGVTPAKVRAFKADLPAIKALVRRVYPGAVRAVSVCPGMDSWFYRLTRLMGWVGHGQYATLEVR